MPNSLNIQWMPISVMFGLGAINLLSMSFNVWVLGISMLASLFLIHCVAIGSTTEILVRSIISLKNAPNNRNFCTISPIYVIIAGTIEWVVWPVKYMISSLAILNPSFGQIAMPITELIAPIEPLIMMISSIIPTIALGYSLFDKRSDQFDFDKDTSSSDDNHNTETSTNAINSPIDLIPKSIHIIVKKLAMGIIIVANVSSATMYAKYSKDITSAHVQRKLNEVQRHKSGDAMIIIGGDVQNPMSSLAE